MRVSIITCKTIVHHVLLSVLYLSARGLEVVQLRCPHQPEDLEGASV